jgi:hypothetical protein
MRKATKKREAAVKAVKDMKNVNDGRDTKPSKSGYCHETWNWYSESWDVSPSSLLSNPMNNKLDKLLGLDTVDGINQYYKQ